MSDIAQTGESEPSEQQQSTQQLEIQPDLGAHAPQIVKSDVGPEEGKNEDFRGIGSRSEVLGNAEGT